MRRPFRLIDSIEGRTEDVLQFPARDGSSIPVSVHPNVFHELLETLPVAGWQVIQTEGALRISLLGTTTDPFFAVNIAALSQSIRTRLEKGGALAPTIEVQRVSALSRGATGKAPLIQSRLTRGEVAV